MDGLWMDFKIMELLEGKTGKTLSVLLAVSLASITKSSYI